MTMGHNSLNSYRTNPGLDLVDGLSTVAVEASMFAMNKEEWSSFKINFGDLGSINRW
jgi:hypothetical protein